MEDIQFKYNEVNDETGYEGDCCRMCMENARELIHLDESFESMAMSIPITYLEALNYCANLRATLDDSLPKIICVECAALLESAYGTIKMAIQSDQNLRELHDKELVIEKVNIEEPNDVYEEQEIDDSMQEENTEFSSRDDTTDLEEAEFVYVEDSQAGYAGDETKSHLDSIEVGPSSVEDKDIDSPEDTYWEDIPSTHEKPKDPLNENTKEQPRASPSRNFICEVCGKMFTSKQKLKMHTLVHTRERNYKCGICSKRYGTIFRCREHMKTHTDLRPFECSYCKQTFLAKHSLVCHTRRHTGERPYRCEICGKTFTQSSIMKTHAALHTGKTVECKHCFKKFSRPSHLILHERTHTGERPYVCHLCPNSYKQKSHLDRHLDTHLGVKHTCSVCGKDYTKRSTLNAHMFVHAETKRFTCPQCNMGFVTKDKFRRHMKNLHCITETDGSAVSIEQREHPDDPSPTEQVNNL